MGLNWGGISMVGGDLDEEDRTRAADVIDAFGDAVDRILTGHGVNKTVSPIFRPFSIIVVWDSEKLIVVFAKSSGMTNQNWLDMRDQIVPPSALVADVQQQTNHEITAVITLPTPPGVPDQIEAAANRHLDELERHMTLARLGDLTGLEHLEPALRAFLEDHPDPDKNIFLMMRFMETSQMGEIQEAVKRTAESKGLHVVRADDRDYTGELWTNIQVCMAGSMLGVAVFEDIDKRDFNPNVSLELGYMLAKQRRCLILKEQRLPTLPADVMHRLYKPFDMFKIDSTVSHQIDRWITVDLQIAV